MNKILLTELLTLAKAPRNCNDMGDFGEFKYYAPISEELIIEAENELGFQIPDTLKQLYLKVGNGGFGPGYGLLGIGPDGCHDDLGRELIGRYKNHKRMNEHYELWDWPDEYLLFCYYGEDSYACLDCNDPKQTVYKWDPMIMDQAKPLPEALLSQNISFENWIRSWVDGQFK